MIYAENIVYPANAGVLNVRDAKYGAKGDGKTDDTAAIQKALTEGLGTHHVVYIPNGVYLVSDTLKWQNPANAGNAVQGWGPFLQLQGQSRAGTIFRLKDGAAGFGDDSAPKAMIQTGSSGSDGGKHYKSGEGNEAFENHLRDFTVSTGKGNAGAVGIDFQVSNCGAMRHVTVQSGDGAGFCGIALTRRDNGPGLLKDVRVEGFRFGIRTFQEIAHFTMEDIQLTGQTEAGLWIRDSVVAARHIMSNSDAPAVQMAGTSLLALFDSNLRGTGSAAVVCAGTAPCLYVRSLQTSGYAVSVRLRGETQPPQLTEWSSDIPLGDPKGRRSLRLPIQETPEWFDPDFAQWADAGAPSGGDDTHAVQAALNAGHKTVYFHYGTYKLQDTLVVPASVRRIQGIGTSLEGPDGKPLFRLEGGKSGDLTIMDRFTLGGQTSALFDHADGRTLVLRDLLPFANPVYRNHAGAGPLFIEDVSGSGYSFAPGTKVWARQWNDEGGVNPKFINDGGTVWALGLKTEGGDTVLENKNGGRAEVWAGFAYTFGVSHDTPAAVNTDAALALQMTGMTYMGANGFYDLLVRDSQGGVTKETRRNAGTSRGGMTLPLYVSGPVAGDGNSTSKSVEETDTQARIARRCCRVGCHCPRQNLQNPGVHGRREAGNSDRQSRRSRRQAVVASGSNLAG